LSQTNVDGRSECRQFYASTAIASSLESLQRSSEVAILVVDGNSAGELKEGLNELRQQAVDCKNVAALAREWFIQKPLDNRRNYAVAFVVDRIGDLEQAIERAIVGLSIEWSLTGTESPSGTANASDRHVFFSPSPVGRMGRLAFVFPGSGNAFVGMGRDLLREFPEVLHNQSAENQRLTEQYRPDLIWNERVSLSALMRDHKGMIFSQVAIGTAICDLLKLCGVHPHASIGYSLGESAALFGLRAWRDRDDMLERMERSTLFGSDLVAPFDAARKAWNLPDGTPVDWVTGIVNRSSDSVVAAIDKLRDRLQQCRVYLLIVNTPNQCVIGGDRSHVNQLTNLMDTTFLAFVAPSTVHCEILHGVIDSYRDLHLMPTVVPNRPANDGVHKIPIDFYGTAKGTRYELNCESAAGSIVDQAIATIDFPKVIRQAYEDGVRFFLEIGPGTSCTRMIAEILADVPFRTATALPESATPIRSFLECLATLIAERVPVDLSYLYGQPGLISPQTPEAQSIVTQLGGPPFQIQFPKVAQFSEPCRESDEPSWLKKELGVDVRSAPWTVPAATTETSNDHCESPLV
ncbi:MAG: acyltransferase domain-containing protein, partial [Planctomycetes bacterium]|nr:acyltransferase domain-containing protein [Planctomycetota bacterium]